MAGDGVPVPNWPPDLPDVELVDAAKFTSDLCRCLSRIQSEFHGLVQRLNMNSRNHGHVRARSRRPNPLDPMMTAAMQDMASRLQERMVEFKKLVERANRICGVVRVPDLLLELHATPTDVEADKLDLIEFRRAELNNEIDWGEPPWEEK